MSLILSQQRWLPGLLAAVICILLFIAGAFHPVQQKLYDSLMVFSSLDPGAEVTVVAIDAPSVDAFGALPWSRDLYARLLDTLYRAQTRIIAITDDLSQAANMPAYQAAQETRHFFASTSLANTPYCANIDCDAMKQEATLLGSRLQNLERLLDQDGVLRASIKKAENVILGAAVQTTHDNPQVLPDALKAWRLRSVQVPFEQMPVTQLLNADALTLPYPPLQEEAHSIGLIPKLDDHRHIPLVLRFTDDYMPTLPLLLAIQARQLAFKDVEVRLGKGIRLGNSPISTDASLRIQPFYYTAPTAQLDVVSAADVLNDKLDPDLFSQRLVLIGTVLPPMDKLTQFARGDFMPPVLSLAHATASLLNGDLLTSAADWVIWLSALPALLWVVWLLPKFSHRYAWAVTLSLSAVLLGITFALFSFYQHWLPLLLPVSIILLGQIFSTQQQRWQNLSRAALNSSEQTAPLRLEGLAYQGQGRLELAFEKFAQCPPDELVMSLLYNLALDFERKRQAREALAVYRYMSSHKPDFRDIEQRMARFDTQRKSFSTSSANLAQWLESDADEKPTLGRYQVERKLAKGAMGGGIYLGTDPKLNRLVALKTLALGEEFEGEELQDATARFFREAAAVGRLSHPNIIAVYDAGEENDLAYISMEFFKGGDLTPFTKPDNLLNLAVIADIIITAAEALDYAHRQGVIHRDIKPANILYNPGTLSLKLTDFGIARIMDTKKTKTGVILGTPSYMSPEQLAGRQVDGRSDLFSLGVTLYQLLSGKLPFTADSMATLMFKIASEPHPDLLSVRPDVPDCLIRIVDKLLYKEPQQRYNSGGELATAMRDCKGYLMSTYSTTTATESMP
jgi:serine/threonine-protein kinase